MTASSRPWFLHFFTALLLFTTSGCGSDRGRKATPTASGGATGRMVQLRVSVAPAMISPRAAEALTSSLKVAPGEKVNPENVPRYFHVTLATGRNPRRVLAAEKQFDPNNGVATLELDRGVKGQTHGLYVVSFKGGRTPLKAILPAFWWAVPPEGLTLSPQTTLWAEVAQEVAAAHPTLTPHAQVWTLLQKQAFDTGPREAPQWPRRRRQLVTWLVTAMKRFEGGRLPVQSRVYAPLCALAITPLAGDPRGNLAARAMEAYHAALLSQAQRAMSATQGKPQLRSKEVVAFMETLNSAPASATLFATNLKSLDRLYLQMGPWPFDETPSAADAPRLAFAGAIPPQKLAKGQVPQPGRPPPAGGPAPGQPGYVPGQPGLSPSQQPQNLNPHIPYPPPDDPTELF